MNVWIVIIVFSQRINPTQVPALGTIQQEFGSQSAADAALRTITSIMDLRQDVDILYSDAHPKE